MRWAIITGTTGTLLVYLFWNTYVLGVIPLTGEISLSSALLQDQTAISPLKKILGLSKVSLLAQAFYFCALTTSFLGVSLATIDFSLDAFSLKKTKQNRLLICLFVFIPALFLSSSSLRVFYLSIKYGAALACVFLLILFPALLSSKMVQHIPKEQPKYNPIKYSIYTAITFSIAVLIAQAMNF